MVSQRQRLARKRFKAEHPELFPKAEPTPPKDPNKKKKKSSAFKRKRAESKSGSGKRQPLRVPGMKPGDSCFICMAKDHIAKLCPQKTEWEKNKICLRCRRRGHRAKNCPEVQDAAKDVKYCYNCGETGHSLSHCPYPLEEGGTKFAECFVCNQQGHLSRNCPQNTHGIYPKGGCCKICGGVTHLAKDCPDKGSQGSVAANGRAGRPMRIEERPRGQVTKFISGDDIEDDFMIDDIRSGDNNKSANSNDVNVTAKKKDPKVVIFN
ncbi:cold shock protein 1 [Vigna radiata var. radiata]|uniref:Cold shock protein 1 n=1 Tax=Vigna radiata var. radiata TaxID=3916 RepID=A0A3Q0FC15_VIGRR|nr:cold shock protein 1 [Vigna radiata var. radiata]